MSPLEVGHWSASLKYGHFLINNFFWQNGIEFEIECGNDFIIFPTKMTIPSTMKFIGKSFFEFRVFRPFLQTSLVRHTLPPRMFWVGCTIWKPQFFWVGHFGIFFCFIPMKISQSFLCSKDGSKFWWLPWFPAQKNPPQTFFRGVYAQLEIVMLNNYYSILTLPVLSNFSPAIDLVNFVYVVRY